MNNKVFDHNGTLVSTSKPVRQLRTVKKTLLIDSADRDTVKYITNGDVIYYLPRVYENVVSIRLKSGSFPRLVAETSPGALTHSYADGPNTRTLVTTNDALITQPAPHYFIVEVEGLNKNDENTVGAQRSNYVDNFFAKIPSTLAQNGSASYFIDYNDHTEEENITRYYPAIGKLDRLHIITRLHSQQGNSGFLYWTSTGAKANGTLEKAAGSDYSLVFEIETLDNGFDDFSSLESRIGNRELGNYGC
jgi:hypothetical protein